MSGAFSDKIETAMSEDSQTPYVRTQDYSLAPKFPTRAARVSELGSFSRGDLLDDGTDTIVVDNNSFSSSTHQFAEGEFVCPGFFSRACLDGSTRRFKRSQWVYEMRREAQAILPFLSLGPSSVLRDREYLRSQGFTLLLAIRNRQSALARLVSGDKAAADLSIQSDAIDVHDNQELISEFPRAIRRINDHLAGVDVDPSVAAHPNMANPVAQDRSGNHKKKVFVFCESGNERSAGVVIAYAMVMLNLEAVSATCMIQQRRFCVSIEDPMKRILIAFGTILAAKRDVERAKHTTPHTGAPTLAPPPVPPVMLAKKRSYHDRLLDDADMLDDGMDLDGEDEMLPERKPIPPFQDRVFN
ncbi:uncharacterized protein N7459_007246 [Penicillium hispanicum]|uniref:uncharacterized protein n=1 Tax=Penicillium hispanicum TaxID=1080232 RepID=UPI0025425204|nr:uncharacterized protein N7459_007246 [Penicillium hispanicum]KAJ5578282.1 hypothetical protein N7459_007246 [Penicillium hispanicum]